MAIRQINLIPAEFFFKKNLFQHLGLWSGLTIVALSLIFGIYFYRISPAYAERLPGIPLENLDLQLKLKIEELTRLQDEFTTLDQKEAGMEIVNTSPIYSHILIRLIENMKENTWVAQLEITRGKDASEGFNLSIKGYTRFNNELGDLIERLSEEPVFSKVILSYATRVVMQDTHRGEDESLKLIEFQVECEVTG